MTDAELPGGLAFAALDFESSTLELCAIFHEYGPAYLKWMRRAAPLPPGHRVQQFRTHMPELVPAFERLQELFSSDEETAAFLSLYRPPRVVRGCSQVVLSDDGPVLLRSYDHHPKLLDKLLLRSRWLGQSTLAMTDCFWGALDGMNESGLAIALAFGGRNTLGDGFAASLVARYVLETCGTVAEARAVLSRVPVYMPYTFVVIDRHDDFVTAYTAPETPTRFVTRRASTNHQNTTDWPAYCRHTQSVERLHTLESLLTKPANTAEALERFLQPPLWQSDYAHGSGTLYIAAYRPNRGTLTLHWPGHTEYFSLTEFQPRRFSAPIDTAPPVNGWDPSQPLF